MKRLEETETFNQVVSFGELGVNQPFVLDGIYVLKKMFIENMRKRVSCKRIYNYLDILKEAIIRDESAIVTMPTLVVKSMLLVSSVVLLHNVFFYNAFSDFFFIYCDETA